MRPPKRLEAPACRTGSSPQNDAADALDAAAEAPGGAGVPNRVFTSERRGRRLGCGRRSAWRRRRAEPGLHLRTTRPTPWMRPPKRLEAPACRTGSSPQNDAADALDAAAEAPGGAGVPNRVFTSERRGRCIESGVRPEHPVVVAANGLLMPDLVHPGEAIQCVDDRLDGSRVGEVGDRHPARLAGQ